MEVGKSAKGKPAQAPEHGDVGDQDPRVGDFDHGYQIVDPPGLDRWSRCPRIVRQPPCMEHLTGRGVGKTYDGGLPPCT